MFPESAPRIIQVRPGQRIEIIGVAPKPLNRTTHTGLRLYKLVTDRADAARIASTTEDAEMQWTYYRPGILTRNDKELENLNKTLHEEGHDGDTVVFALKDYLRTTLHRPDEVVIDTTARFMADSLGFAPEPNEQVA